VDAIRTNRSGSCRPGRRGWVRARVGRGNICSCVPCVSLNFKLLATSNAEIHSLFHVMILESGVIEGIVFLLGAHIDFSCVAGPVYPPPQPLFATSLRRRGFIENAFRAKGQMTSLCIYYTQRILRKERRVFPQDYANARTRGIWSCKVALL
jgi:hypothetical protein